MCAHEFGRMVSGLLRNIGHMEPNRTRPELITEVSDTSVLIDGGWPYSVPQLWGVWWGWMLQQHELRWKEAV